MRLLAIDKLKSHKSPGIDEIPAELIKAGGGGEPEGKRPLGRPWLIWVGNFRMDLQEVGCWHVDWIGLAQHKDGWRKLVNAVRNLRFL